ncbi:MAG: caspase family protein [Chitinophagales bacterium]
MKTNLLKLCIFLTLSVSSLSLYSQGWGVDILEILPYNPTPPEIQWINSIDTVHSSKFPLILEVNSIYPIESVRTKINNNKSKTWNRLFLPENAQKRRKQATDLLQKGRANYKILPPYPLYKGKVIDQIEILELSLQSGINKIEVAITNKGKTTKKMTFYVFYKDSPNNILPVLHLVTIGVGNYLMEDIQTLNYPAKDAEAIDSVFVSQKDLYNTVKRYHLTDSLATTEAINTLIEEVKNSVKKNDVIMAFFSGHGDKTYYSNISQEEIRFMPYNFDHENKVNTGILGSSIISEIERMPCNSLIIFDACHSGKIVSNNLLSKSSSARKAMKMKVKRRLKRNKKQSVILTASAEEAYEHPDWKHGALTTAILEVFNNQINTHFTSDDKEESLTISRNGKRWITTPQLLQEIAGDNLIDAQELLRYVNHRVPELVRGQEAEQIPVFKGKGDFFIFQTHKK